MDFRMAVYKILADLQNGDIKGRTAQIGMLDVAHSEALIMIDRAHQGIGSADELISEVGKMSEEG